MDRLSEEEAGIIAARWVRRVEAKTPLAKDKAEGLQRSLADSLRKDLTGENARQMEVGSAQADGLEVKPAVVGTADQDAHDCAFRWKDPHGAGGLDNARPCAGCPWWDPPSAR